MKRQNVFLCIAAVVLTAATLAPATVMNLSVFENDSHTSVKGLNLWVDAIDRGPFVDFVFHNDSTDSSVVTALYFEATPFAADHLAIGWIDTPQPKGVSFDYGATPNNPPGSIKNYGGAWHGNLFSADANSPSPKNGIAPGESLTIRFWQPDGDFCDLTKKLNDSSQFRIVEHVQGLCKDNSVWVVSGQTVPLPGTLTLMSGALAVLALRPRLFRHLA